MVFDISHAMEQSGTSLKTKIEELEKAEIIRALKESNWIMARAAKTLGITERMIGYKIRKYGIRFKEVRWAVDEGPPHQERTQ